MYSRSCILSVLGLMAVGLSASVPASVPLVDFTRPGHGWQALNHVTNAVSSSAGLAFDVTDEDPWLVGAPFDFPRVPANAEVRFTVTCAPTDCARDWQLFFASGKEGFSEQKSGRLAPEGKPPYTRFSGDLPASIFAAGPARLRLDPPGVRGARTVRKLEMAIRPPLFTYAPSIPPPLDLDAASSLVLKGRNWELRHDPRRFGGFRFTANGKSAEGHPGEPFVCLDAAGNVWTFVPGEAKMTAAWNASRTELTTRASCLDAEGRIWNLTRRFLSVEEGRALTIVTTVAPDRPANVLHAPLLTLFVERGSGGHKRQAMLAGVEYLADEPSSSRAEIRTAEHDRTIPAEYRLSAPLAAFTDDGHWLGFAWDRLARGVRFARPAGPAPFATVFDSPDRVFRSGGHLLGFWIPAVGPVRRESSRTVYAAVPLETAATHAITLRGGAGGDIATALETLVPPDALPVVDAVDDRAAADLLARGWLDSSIRRGTEVRHASASNFAFGRAADAAFLMKYLARRLDGTGAAETARAVRLRDVASAMLARIRPREVPHLGVSHVRRPAPVLVGGDITNHLADCAAKLGRLNRLHAGVRRVWHRPEGRRDYGETLGADHCNGYTAMVLSGLLGTAVWCGDEAEIARTLAIVDRIAPLYHGTVPRGAQPWEMPLHTPDIMASAHLVRIYTLAYLLRPDPAYLREARHWAYTGLSMVYLVPPPAAFPAGVEPIGRYATCAVMGATNWCAPNWIGRPVQWCGLVYAAALWDLARLDAVHGDFWRKIADGITVSGLRQTHPITDGKIAGLLPDSINLLTQGRYFCPINPGTVEENFCEHLGLPFYALCALPRTPDDARPALLHAAGLAEALPSADGGARRARLELWPETPSRVVVTRVAQAASVTFNGRPVPFDCLAAHRALVVTLPAGAKGELCVK